MTSEEQLRRIAALALALSIILAGLTATGTIGAFQDAETFEGLSLGSDQPAVENARDGDDTAVNASNSSEEMTPEANVTSTSESRTSTPTETEPSTATPSPTTEDLSTEGETTSTPTEDSSTEDETTESTTETQTSTPPPTTTDSTA